MGVKIWNFSGKNIVYYSNKHFEANNDIIYKDFNSPETNNTNGANSNIILKTNKAIGEVMSAQDKPTNSLLAKNTLKYMVMPNKVDFYFDDNIGQTSDVYFDAVKKTLDTTKAIESHGMRGNIKGVGFFYSMNDGKFILKSNVEGMINPQNQTKIKIK